MIDYLALSAFQVVFHLTLTADWNSLMLGVKHEPIDIPVLSRLGVDTDEFDIQSAGEEAKRLNGDFAQFRNLLEMH